VLACGDTVVLNITSALEMLISGSATRNKIYVQVF
jgi:hypothetical protein